MFCCRRLPSQDLLDKEYARGMISLARDQLRLLEEKLFAQRNKCFARATLSEQPTPTAAETERSTLCPAETSTPPTS
jgi:hypothetical protein